MSVSGASTYVWNPGGNGATIVVTPTTTTQYTVIATDVNGCSSNTVFTQNVTNCGTTGLKNNVATDATIQVYPNPFGSELIIKTLKEHVGQSFVIINVIGEKVFEGETNTELIKIDLDQLSAGIYYISCGSFTGKIIKTEH